ncbi:MAG: hypothetical protein ACAI44_10145, partial [Candidatus Sericytochromatia bacterium]
MNVNNGGQSIQQRIESLKKSQEPQTVIKTPIETSLTGPTFAERKAIFEKQTGKVEVHENLLDVSHTHELEDTIDQSDSESIRERSSELHDSQGKLGYGYSSSEQQNNYLVKSNDDEGGKKGYGYQVQENEGQENESSEQGQKSSDKSVHSYDVIAEQVPPRPKLQQHGLEPLDPGTSSYVDSRPKKHQETAENHHEIQERGKSNVEGVQRGYEFGLKGQSKYTVMFSSKESQHENQLGFGPKGVTRGDSEELLSTQSPSKSQWAGSKADRMLFVMSPQGEFYTIDPIKEINIKGATVMDVRIHHSSLLDGQEV